MMITRRTLAAGAVGALTTGATARATDLVAVRARPIIVIAHRGASGERPEHTPMAYRLAIAQRADFIEPDLVLTRDGHLVARHENEIGGTTDVASKPEFAGRKATKIIDGQSVAGWFTEDFTLAELKTLRCRERLPQLRPANTKYDGQEAIPTFDEVVAIAKAGKVGIYPEMKHPTHFASLGLAFPERMATALKTHGLEASDLAFVQCFEVGPLKALRRLAPKANLVQLIDSEGGPADLPGARYADMATTDGLEAISTYADGVGPDKSYIVPTDGVDLLPPTSFVMDARRAGLLVHPWTVRVENYFLPKRLQRMPWRRGDPPTPIDPRAPGDASQLLKALYDAGVDGVFTDFPGVAVYVRVESLLP